MLTRTVFFVFFFKNSLMKKHIISPTTQALCYVFDRTGTKVCGCYGKYNLYQAENINCILSFSSERYIVPFSSMHTYHETYCIFHQALQKKTKCHNTVGLNLRNYTKFSLLLYLTNKTNLKYFQLLFNSELFENGSKA